MALTIYLVCFLICFHSVSVFGKLDPEPSKQDVLMSRNTFSTHLKYAMPSVDTEKNVDESNDTALQMDSSEQMSSSVLNSVTVSSEDEDMDVVPKTILRFKPLRLASMTTPSPFVLSSNPITVTPAVKSTTSAPSTIKKVFGQPKSNWSKPRIKYTKLKPTRITLHTLPSSPTSTGTSSASSNNDYGFIHSAPINHQNLITSSTIKNERCPSFEQLYTSSSTSMSEREPATSTRDIDVHQVQYYLDKARSGLIQFQDKVRRELSELREKESVLNENLLKVSKMVNSNDAALTSCQNHLNTLETSVNEVYGREKDIESRAGSLENENAMLRDRLRKLSGIEIKRKPISGNGTISGSAISGSISRTRSKAVISYKNETVASFGTILYKMSEDNLIKIEDVIKNVHVPITKGFDYLKIIRTGYDYKLTLANSRGNSFFDHKKFDKYYSNIPDEVRFIKTSSLIAANEDNDINWVEHNTRCGFWSCFFLKPGIVDSAPQVFSVRDKSLIGHLSPTTAYFDLNYLVINNGTNEEKFAEPFIDKDIEGNFFIADGDGNDWKKRDNSKRLIVDLNSLEINDKHSFANMVKNAFP